LSPAQNTELSTESRQGRGILDPRMPVSAAGRG